MSENYQPETCGYCRKRGSACKKHGGTDTTKYVPAKERAGGGADDKPPKPYVSVPSQKDHQPAPEIFPSGFADPYNCSMCARKGALCDMHERFRRDEKAKPAAPVAAVPTPATLKATEQKVGGHRIVKIIAGNVTITIQEPLS